MYYGIEQGFRRKWVPVPSLIPSAVDPDPGTFSWIRLFVPDPNPARLKEQINQTFLLVCRPEYAMAEAER